MVLALLLGCAACGGGGKKDTTGPNGNGNGGDGAGGGGAVTLVSVKADGGSCVAVVRDAGGEQQTHAAASELCPGGAKDASALVGRPVNLEMGAAATGDSPSALPSGEDPCRDIAPPCGGDASGGGQMVIGITAA